MSRYDSDEEQVEAIKNWWNKYGTQLLSAVLIVVLGFAGYRYWTNTQYVAGANASATFEMLQSQMQDGNFGEVSREALKLTQEQPESPYATAAAMLYAKFSFTKGEFEQAAEQYEWVLEHSQDQSLRAIAALRLARLQIDMQQFKQAEKVLTSLDKKTLSAPNQANFSYIEGLLALQQNQSTQAKKSFAEVTQNPQADQNLMGLAQIQLDDLTQK